MVGIAVFVGVIGAFSFIAGARRSASVVDRFFAAAPHDEGVVFAQSFEKDGQTVAPQLTRADVAKLPGVERAGPAGYINFQACDRSGAVIGGYATPVSVETTALLALGIVIGLVAGVALWLVAAASDLGNATRSGQRGLFETAVVRASADHPDRRVRIDRPAAARVDLEMQVR